jgi:hypothetical protein
MSAWIAAIATVGAALVALYYAILTRRLWEATRLQAAMTRDLAELARTSFEADHRPWISIDVAWGAPAYRTIDFTLANVGSAPAVVTSCRVEVTKHGKPLGSFDREPPGATALFPGRGMKWPSLLFEEPDAKWDRHEDVIVTATADYQRPGSKSSYRTTIVTVVGYGGRITGMDVDLS